MSKPYLQTINQDLVKVSVVTDGTHTQAEVISLDGPTGPVAVGKGGSQRRTWTTPSGKAKGDPRNNEIGVALALSRAFADAARHFEEIAQSHLGGEEKE